MSGSDDVFPTENPFPSTPAAQLRGVSRNEYSGRGVWGAPATVETDARRTLQAQVGEYLDPAEETATRGRALGLVGGFGMGKSHLAGEVVARFTQLARSGDGGPLWVVGQPGLDMGAVYRDLLTAMFDDNGARAAFERVVETFHAQVTATALEEDRHGRDDHSAQEFVQLLREDQLNSQKVVASFGLDEERIHRRLRAELRGVTGHRRFATALALLLDPRFRLPVWDWLTGAEPAVPLRERGITAPLDGTRDVFEAFTVFGFLHGQVGKPYGFVVDSLEVVLEWPRRERQDFLDGLESLVNSYVNRGGLVLMCTQPERWDQLPLGLHERVLQIWPDRLDAERTAALIDAYVHRPRPGRAAFPPDLAPFTRQAVEQLALLGDGVPRRILKICRQAWQLMRADRRSGVDGPEVHEAVRALNEGAAVADVRESVERALARRQFHRETAPEELRSAGDLLRDVAYWVRAGEHDVVAVMVVRSVLLDSEVLAIDATARTARAVFDGGCRTLVLINGAASRDTRDRIAQFTGASPLLVGEPGFEERVGEAVALLVDRLGAERQGGQVADLRGGLAEMSAQQAAVLDIVRRLEAPPAATAEHSDGLPEQVAALFTAAGDALDDLAGAPADTAGIFTVDETGLPAAGAGPRRLTFTSAHLEAFGLRAAIERLLTAFRDGVADWWRVAGRAGHGPGTPARAGLSALCRSFEISLEVLPVLRPPGAPHRTAAGAARTAAAQDRLNGLAEEVRAALLG